MGVLNIKVNKQTIFFVINQFFLIPFYIYGVFFELTVLENTKFDIESFNCNLFFKWKFIIPIKCQFRPISRSMFQYLREQYQ